MSVKNLVFATMANHLYQLLHPVVAPPNDTSSAPETASPTTTTEPSSTSTINVPRQVIKQVSTFFQQFTHQVPQHCDSTPSATISDILANSPSNADEILSEALE